MTNLTLEEKKELIRMALAAREKAYVPYSDFMVGAALRAKDGRIFTGCRKLQGIQCRLTLGYGDSLVVHDLNSAIIICRKGHGTLTGTGQTAAHRNVYDLVIFL